MYSMEIFVKLGICFENTLRIYLELKGGVGNNLFKHVENKIHLSYQKL